MSKPERPDLTAGYEYLRAFHAALGDLLAVVATTDQPRDQVIRPAGIPSEESVSGHAHIILTATGNATVTAAAVATASASPPRIDLDVIKQAAEFVGLAVLGADWTWEQAANLMHLVVIQIGQALSSMPILPPPGQ